MDKFNKIISWASKGSYLFSQYLKKKPNIPNILIRNQIFAHTTGKIRV